MKRALLRAVRRMLKEVDILLERDRSGIDPLGGRSNGRGREIDDFLSKLNLGVEAAHYLADHRRRLIETLQLVPPGEGRARALELGCYMQMAPVLARILDYAVVRGAYYAPEIGCDRKIAEIAGESAFECDIDLFDVERHRFPYEDAAFDLILCCELIEHLMLDPMHLLLESHRVLAKGGLLLLSTPNIGSYFSVASILHGWRNPQVFSRYPKAGNTDTPHVREYTPKELTDAVSAAGFEIQTLVTERMPGFDEYGWVRSLLQREGFDTQLRGEQIYCLALKRDGAATDRHPSFLYAG